MYNNLDWFLSLKFFYPILKGQNHKSTPIPVLMYHSISSLPIEHTHPYYWINTSPKRFKEQLFFLKSNDFKVINLDEALEKLKLGINVGAKYVVITFDDGYEDFYKNAFPILNQFEYSATIFLITSYIGKIFNNRKCLDWNQINDLYRSGIEFGSHTVNHPKLSNLSHERIAYEVGCSKKVIEDKTGQKVTSFCYPYAFPEYNKAFKKFLYDTLYSFEYQNCITTNIGRLTGEGEYFIKRIPINSRDDTSFFKAKISGAYDWVYYMQNIVKLIKRVVHS